MALIRNIILVLALCLLLQPAYAGISNPRYDDSGCLVMLNAQSKCKISYVGGFEVTVRDLGSQIALHVRGAKLKGMRVLYKKYKTSFIDNQNVTFIEVGFTEGSGQQPSESFSWNINKGLKDKILLTIIQDNMQKALEYPVWEPGQQ